MRYEVSFGSISRAPRAASAGTKFRLALLGDFSGRANAGRLETGAALAARKPIKVDVDNFDQVIERMQLSLALPLAEDDGAVTVPIRNLDDFHPDQLAENVELFEQLLDLRRRLGSRTGFDRAAKEVLSWSGGAPLPRAPRKARGAAVASDRRLSDFARLVGRPAVADADEASVDDLIRRLVGPYIQPKRDARQDQLIARVDEALSAAMRRVLHHPDFQAAEAIWRGVEFLVRRIETGARMEIVLYDVSAEEFAADLAATDALEETGLYGMLVEQPALDAAQGPLSAIIGLYGFELAPPHADLLGRVARIAAAARAPFVAGIDPDALKTRFHDQHPLIKDAWSALHALPEAAYLGLAAPRFLLRPPYGRKSDPIDAFSFEEFTPQGGLGAMLWGHPALLSGLLLAETWLQQGKAMRLGTVMGVGRDALFRLRRGGRRSGRPALHRAALHRARGGSGGGVPGDAAAVAARPARGAARRLHIARRRDAGRILGAGGDGRAAEVLLPPPPRRRPIARSVGTGSARGRRHAGPAVDAAAMPDGGAGASR